MAYQQADLDVIRAAISSGVMRVRFADGREVFYQSLSSLMEAEQRIAASVAASSGGCRRRYPAYRTGI